MRVLYIDQYFSDREGISGTRGYEFARRWVAQGHHVTVLALASRYSSLCRQPQRKLIRRLDVDGVHVVSVRISYAQHMGIAARLHAFFSFMIWSSLLGIFSARHDVVFATSTPLTVGVPGCLISRLRGTPFVFEVRDLWPRAPIELGMLANPAAISLARFAEKLFYRLAARVIALSPGMVDGVTEAGTPREKISLAPNACDFDLFDAADPQGIRAELGLPAKALVLVHAGALGTANDGSWLVDLAAALQKAKQNNIRLLLLGEGNDRIDLEQRVHSKGLTNIVFAGPVTRNEAARIIKACDVGLVSFADFPVLKTNSPNKFFDYLAAGLPVAVNTDGWTAELLRRGHAGLLLPRNANEAAAALSELAKDGKRRKVMGYAAKELGREFDRDKIAAQVFSTLVEAAQEKTCGLDSLLKRATDVLLTSLALAIASPFLLLIAFAIRRDSPGSVFYRQERIGRDGKAFRLWKFRTMVVGADKMGDGLNVGAGDSRITRVGSFLREWSLDEAPQLFNVMLGDMSLVGPRPALREHAEMYNDHQRQRLRVRPGLTGLAQINGRNSLTWDQKLNYDVQYAATWSWWSDLKIIYKTIPVVLGREGLYEPEAGVDDRFNKFEESDDRTIDD